MSVIAEEGDIAKINTHNWRKQRYVHRDDVTYIFAGVLALPLAAHKGVSVCSYSLPGLP